MLAQGGILHYAKQITSAASDVAQVLDCVIVVPPFFGPAQRQALYDAAHLAGSYSALAQAQCLQLSGRSAWTPRLNILAFRAFMPG